VQREGFECFGRTVVFKGQIFTAHYNTAFLFQEKVGVYIGSEVYSDCQSQSVLG
jgi:hypothetical protein